MTGTSVARGTPMFHVLLGAKVYGENSYTVYVFNLVLEGLLDFSDILTLNLDMFLSTNGTVGSNTARDMVLSCLFVLMICMSRFQVFL